LFCTGCAAIIAAFKFDCKLYFKLFSIFL
jgi:hypothetical protein